MGVGNASQEFFDRPTERIIRDHACRVVRRAGLAPFEKDDIAQELRLHLWQQRDRHVEQRGRWTTFARCLVERKAAVLLGRYRAQRRNGRRVAYSIDASFIRSDAGELCGTDRLDRELLRSGGTASLSRTESELNRRIDVGNVIRQLDPRGRRLARQLMEHRVAELASITGVSRGTLYDRIAELRSSLMRHGIRASSHPTVWSRNQ